MEEISKNISYLFEEDAKQKSRGLEERAFANR